MHGFNRLGGNSVSETVVAGMIVGDYFAKFCQANEIDVNTSTIHSALKKQSDFIEHLLNNKGEYNIFEIKNRMRDIMWEKVAIFRDGEGLSAAVNELEELLKKSHNVNVKSKTTSANPELEEAYRVPMMLKLALCVAMGARERTESRGAHYREDHLKRDDVNWLKRTLTSWKEGATLPTVSYEDLDIMKMEIPPAFRGYGAKGMIIENELSLKRQEEVDRLREEMEAAGKDRHDIQEALMPFELQPYYKVKNERFGDAQ